MFKFTAPDEVIAKPASLLSLKVAGGYSNSASGLIIYRRTEFIISMRIDTRKGDIALMVNYLYPITSSITGIHIGHRKWSSYSIDNKLAAAVFDDHTASDVEVCRKKPVFKFCSVMTPLIVGETIPDRTPIKLVSALVFPTLPSMVTLPV